MSDSKSPLVSIIIVNYNGESILGECLESLRLTIYHNYEVIVVDNCSVDNSCSLVEAQFPEVRLIKLEHNFGFSTGNNKGMLNAKGDFIVLLNNDTVVSPMWLTELMNEAIKNPYCFYQPKILLLRNGQVPIINSAGNFITVFGFAFPRGIYQIDMGQYSRNSKVSYASGACVLASKSLIQKVGLLDDEANLYIFYEDVNWGWKASMLGYQSIYVSSSTIYHKWGGSWGNALSPKKYYYLELGRLSTFFRNYSTRTLIILSPLVLLLEFSLTIYSLISGFGHDRIAVYVTLLKKRDVITNQRRELQSMRLQNDKTVLAHFSSNVTHPYLGRLSNLLTQFSNFAKKILEKC